RFAYGGGEQAAIGEGDAAGDDEVGRLVEVLERGVHPDDEQPSVADGDAVLAGRQIDADLLELAVVEGDRAADVPAARERDGHGHGEGVRGRGIVRGLGIDDLQLVKVEGA